MRVILSRSPARPAHSARKQATSTSIALAGLLPHIWTVTALPAEGVGQIRVEAMKRMNSISRIVGFVALASMANQLPVLAQKPGPDLTQVSLEDLMNIEITSASRKEQRATDVAAAVFVITSEDIRRSGMTTIPDMLRMVPGVDVAQVNSNKWAVTIRGFNAVYANKLLVLVDGRTIYSPIFAGVLWDSVDVMLDDVEHIEVVRGPGAAIWGANAVNGVINIVTKSAAETQGGLVRVEGGGAGEQGAARYGGTLGAGSYRLFSQWSGRAESVTVDGAPAGDPSRNVTTGFRADWPAGPSAFTLEGDFSAGQSHALWPNLDPQTAAREPVSTDPSTTRGGHLLGRWTRTGRDNSSLQVQTFVDFAQRDEPVADYARRAADIDAQFHTALGARHDLVAGAGYRFIDERYVGRVNISLTPVESGTSLLTAFAQDEIALFGKRMAVTLGGQMQYDSSAGAGVQPTARVIWKGLPRQRLWAATSRALRTPSLTERGIRLEYPPVPTAAGLPLVVTYSGNRAAQTETLVDAEAGYRLEIGGAASVDVTGFVGRYDHLATAETSVPVVQLIPSPRILVATRIDNQLEAATHGLEIAGHWTLVPTWRLEGSYTAFHLTPHLAADSQDPTAAMTDGTAPRAQWRLASVFSPTTRSTVNVAIFHVGPLEELQVAAYTRADVNAEWRFSSRLSLMAIGQNLLDAAHAESAGTGALLLPTQVPRSVSLRMRWALR
jgi:iron complex outermembrane recepter protein